MKNSIILILLISFSTFVFLNNCQNFKNPTASEEEIILVSDFDSINEIMVLNKKTQNYNAEIAEDNLRNFAKAFAVIVENRLILNMLRQEIAKEFDGQPEVLYSKVRDIRLADQSTLESCLEKLSHSSQSRSREPIQDIARSVENLEKMMNINLFMPWFKSWDGKTIPLVAFVPQLVDDDKLEEFHALNSKGEIVNIPISKAHEFSYIIIGANERTNENGELLDYKKINNRTYRIPIPNSIESLKKAAATTSDTQELIEMYYNTTRPTGTNEKLAKMKVNNDHENYAVKGDPEISMIFTAYAEFGSGHSVVLKDYHMDHQFDGHWSWGWHYDDTSWNTINKTMWRWWVEDYHNVAGYKIYERDGNSIEIKIPIKVKPWGKWSEIGVELKTTINGPDDLGQGVINFKDPSPEDHTTGTVDFQMKWDL
jgi:hypothetical protein